MKEILYKDLGLMGYSECWDYQRLLFERMLAAKAGDAEHARRLSARLGGYFWSNTIPFTH